MWEFYEKKEIRQLLQKGGANMCFIQESNVSQVVEGLITSIWGSMDCKWSAKEADGRARGIITIWKKGVIQPVFSFKGRGF